VKPLSELRGGIAKGQRRIGEKIEGKITTAYRGMVKGFADCETLNVITR